MSVISFRHLHNVSTIGSGSVKFKVYAPYQLPQLSTPQNVSASGTTVSWTAVENATSYKILADGKSIGTETNVSYNLNNSAGWANLSDGNHNITIVAKADGYRDSEPSSAVVVTKATTPVEDELAGTWVFNERLDLHIDSIPNTLFEFPFYTEDGLEYSALSIDFLDEATGEYTGMSYDGNQVYGLVEYTPVWENEINRTITTRALLDELPNGQELLAFLQMNATKKGEEGATLISFTINGTSYQAEDGMTWGQWVDSTYNTGSYVVYNGVITKMPEGTSGSRVTTDSAFNNAVRPDYYIYTATAYYMGQAN